MYTKALPVKAQRRDECHTLLWGRVFGEFGSFGSNGNNGDFAKGGPAYDFDFGGFQAGADLYRTAWDSAGLYAGAATAHANVRTADGGASGHLGLDTYGFGAYWTHRDPVGWYTDLVLQGNLYQNINTTSEAGIGFHTQGWGITASAEAGYKIALGGGYSVIPQGQLIYQRTSLDGGVDQFGRISFGPTDEVYGRLGGRFAKDWLINETRKVTTWAEANIWQQFGSDAKTTFATLDGAFPTTVGAGLGGTWAQLGVGLSGQVTRNVSIFGVADYNIALNQSGHSVGGRIGIKVTW
jgi:outer membrane autotransporter protein